MKKFFASMAAMVAILAGMLVATGTASATGGTTSPTFTCANVLGVGQVCENLDNVIVIVTHLGILSGSELAELENILNDLAVNGIYGDVNIIKGDILNLYHNDFNIPVLSGNVIVIGWPTCGC
jgi:hypothetical protein